MTYGFCQQIQAFPKISQFLHAALFMVLRDQEFWRFSMAYFSYLRLEVAPLDLKDLSAFNCKEGVFVWYTLLALTLH